jgi:ABC-type Fe3+ transport system permease subunit
VKRLWLIFIGAAFVLVALSIAPALLVLMDVIRQPTESAEALVDGVMWQRLATTLALAGATLAIALPMGMLQAWLYVRSDVPFGRVLLMLCSLPLFLPPLVHVLSWFYIVPLRGWPAIVLVYVISFTPLIVLLCAQSLQRISREHYESMLLAGGRWAVVRDELRQSLPAAMVGSTLVLVLLLADFATADFLTSVGPKVTVYGDTLYGHHVAGRSAGAVAASFPGLVLCMALLAWALHRRARLGTAVGPRFAPAPRIACGRKRWALLMLAAAPVVAGSALPLISLLLQAGSLHTIFEQIRIASDRIWFTLGVGAAAATVMVLLGLLLAVATAHRRGRLLFDGLILLPLAMTPLMYGIGLIRVWNRPGLDAIYLGVGIVIIAMAGRYLAFAYLPLSSTIERLDRSMLESARLAGAGPWLRLWHVVLPMLRSPMAGAWCVSFCFTLRELDSLIMLRAGQQSLIHHLYANVVFARQDEVAAIALVLAAITFLPLLVYLMIAGRSLRLVS